MIDIEHTITELVTEIAQRETAQGRVAGTRERDRLEPLAGRRIVRVSVRVKPPGHLAVRLLDLVRGGRVGDAEDLVEVPLRHLGLPRIGVDLHAGRPKEGALEAVPCLEGALVTGWIEGRLG